MTQSYFSVKMKVKLKDSGIGRRTGTGLETLLTFTDFTGRYEVAHK